jgi:hypothetical protein
LPRHARLDCRKMNQSSESVRWIAEPDFLMALLRSGVHDWTAFGNLINMTRGRRVLAVYASGDMGPTVKAIRTLSRTLWASLAARLRRQ